MSGHAYTPRALNSVLKCVVTAAALAKAARERETAAVKDRADRGGRRKTWRR